MDVEPGGERRASARRPGSALLDPLQHEPQEPAAPDLLPVQVNGVDGSARLLAAERALRVLAEERAVRAEAREVALRATFAVVTSVAEVSIEAAVQLADEARRYAQVLAEAVRQEQVSTVESASAKALQVIAEARAAVAELRADLQGDDPDDEADSTVDAADHDVTASRRPWPWRRRTQSDAGGALRAALREGGNRDRPGASRPASFSRVPGTA